MDFDSLRNPVFECEPRYSPRDPAAVYHEEVFFLVRWTVAGSSEGEGR